TFRHLAYEGYKAQRKGMPDELASQMPLLKEVLAAMKIPMYELDGWEADDLIGTISVKDTAAGWATVIVTGDKDSLQLVTDTTTVKLVSTRMGRTTTKDMTPTPSGSSTARSHPHCGPEGPDGGQLRQHPRGRRGEDCHGPSAVSFH
ncbi:MAG: PIN domain-containing protein, partial [Flavonifractor plautii]